LGIQDAVFRRLVSPRFYLPAACCLFLLLSLLMALPSLNHYWFNDDLFFIRPFSSAELVSAFSSDWEPSGISTPGYRPITPLYYHVTHALFGQNIVLYRLFAVILFALLLTAVMLVALELGTPPWAAFLAGIIILVTKNTWWMLTWPADSIRTWNLLLVLLAIYLFLRTVNSFSIGRMVLSAALFFLALFTREDVLIFAPVLLLIGAYRLVLLSDAPGGIRQVVQRQGSRVRTVVVMAIMLTTGSGLFWLLRSQFVPGAESSADLAGWFYSLLWVFLPRLAVPSITIWIACLVFFWAVTALLLRSLPRMQRSLALFWMACTVVSAATGLVVTRANTLLPSICFLGLFLALVYTGGAQGSRLRAGISGVTLAVFLFTSAAQHHTAQRSLALNSTEYINETARYFWGEWSPAYAYIPQERIDFLRAYFANLGINTPEAYAENLPRLIESGRLFVPADGWLSGW
jgi:hypothetical protein